MRASASEIEIGIEIEKTQNTLNLTLSSPTLNHPVLKIDYDYD